MRVVMMRKMLSMMIVIKVVVFNNDLPTATSHVTDCLAPVKMLGCRCWKCFFCSAQ